MSWRFHGGEWVDVTHPSDLQQDPKSDSGSSKHRDEKPEDKRESKPAAKRGAAKSDPRESKSKQ